MPSKRPGSPVDGGLLASHTSTTATPTRFFYPDNLFSVSALIDFGTDGSFMDWNLLCHLQLDLKTISGARQICAAQWPSALSGHLRHYCPCSYLVIKMRKSVPRYSLTLGYLWLRKHNSGLESAMRKILGWSQEYLPLCQPPVCSHQDQDWCLWVCRPVQGSWFLPKKERGFW